MTTATLAAVPFAAPAPGFAVTLDDTVPWCGFLTGYGWRIRLTVGRVVIEKADGTAHFMGTPAGILDATGCGAALLIEPAYVAGRLEQRRVPAWLAAWFVAAASTV